MGIIYKNSAQNCIKLLVQLLWILCVQSRPQSVRPSYEIDDSTLKFLQKYGYLSQIGDEASSLLSEEVLRSAIKSMQMFGRVPATGLVDELTRDLMLKPRCGLPDLQLARSKRYVTHGNRWNHYNLTWSLQKGTSQILDDAVRREAGRALNLWSSVSMLNFKKIESDRADILVSFHRGSHSDAFAFDGKGNTLAHAYFPGKGIGGDAHFDDDEVWVEHDGEGTSFFAVAVHEFGHSLGLKHSSEDGSIMLPYYRPIPYNFTLHDDDIAGIQSLYGVRDEKFTLPTVRPTEATTASKTSTNLATGDVTVVPTRRTTPAKGVTTPTTKSPTKLPDICDTSYDAVTVISSNAFFFKGQYFWRLDRGGKIVNPTPIDVHRFFRGLPSNLTRIDAIFQRKTKTAEIYIFIGQHFWIGSSRSSLVFTGPFPLTDLGLPASLSKLNAAFVWGHNGKTYFFNDTNYWRLDDKTGKVGEDYPRDMAVWKNVPMNIDSAFQYKSKTYFFKGKVFWAFNDRTMSLDSQTATLSAPFWTDCSPDVPLASTQPYLCVDIIVFPFLFLVLWLF